MDQIIPTLRLIPFWAWVIIPVALLAMITYVASRNLRYTFAAGVLGLLAAWGAAGFYLWETYLKNHFVGYFDQYGLPTGLSRSGFYLLIDAWPLWLVPSLVIAAFTFGITWSIKRYLRHLTIEALSQAPQPLSGTANQDVLAQLELKQVKHQYAVAKEKLKQHKKTGAMTSRQENTLQENLQITQAQLEARTKEAQKLKQLLSTKDEELVRSKALIERLLDEKFESKDI